MIHFKLFDTEISALPRQPKLTETCPNCLGSWGDITPFKVVWNDPKNGDQMTWFCDEECRENWLGGHDAR